MAPPHDFLAAYTAEQVASCDEANRRMCEDASLFPELNPHPTRVSTMTFGAQLSHELDLPTVRELDFVGTPLVVSQRSARARREHEVDGPHKPFSNQLTLLHPRQAASDGICGVCSVLLFRNGYMTIAGCKNVQDFNMVVASVLRLLTPVVQGVTVVRAALNMLNAHLKLDVNLALFKVNEKLIETAGVSTGFDPTTYHAVTVKYPTGDKRRLSFSIFQSGSILITVKAYSELVVAHRFICSTLHAALPELTT